MKNLCPPPTFREKSKFLAKTTNEYIFMFQTRMGDTTQGGEGKLKLKLKRYVNLHFMFDFCQAFLSN